MKLFILFTATAILLNQSFASESEVEVNQTYFSNKWKCLSTCAYSYNTVKDGEFVTIVRRYTMESKVFTEEYEVNTIKSKALKKLNSMCIDTFSKIIQNKFKNIKYMDLKTIQSKLYIEKEGCSEI